MLVQGLGTIYREKLASKTDNLKKSTMCLCFL